MASISAVRWEKHHKARKDLNVILASFFIHLVFRIYLSFGKSLLHFFFILRFCTFVSSSAMSAAKNHKIFHFSLILVAIIKSTKMIHSSMYSLLLWWVHFRRGFRVDTRHVVVNADWSGFFGNKSISFYNLAVTVIASCRILELVIFAPIDQTETEWNLSDLWLQDKLNCEMDQFSKKKM